MTEAELANRILPKLLQIDETRRAMEVLEEEYQKLRAAVQTELNAAGLKTVDVGDFRASVQTTHRTSLDKKKLLAQGVTMDQIEAATVTTPGNPHLRVVMRGGGMPGCDG